MTATPFTGANASGTAGAPLTLSITISDVPPAVPTLGVSPVSLPFGSVTVGQTAGLNLQLTNQGTTNLVIDATTISGTGATQFSDNFNDAANVTLAPSASTTVLVTFAPTSASSKTATLSIAHTGGNTPVSVPLSGTGTSPTAPTLGVSPVSLPFGSVTVGQTTGLNLQLTNQGTTSLVIDATTISGTDATQFSDNFNDAANVTLAPSASTTVLVTFAPTSASSKTATLSIAHTGGNTPVSVPLSGTGSTPGGLQVTHFSLINADTDLPISGFDMMTGGQVVLNLATLPSEHEPSRTHAARTDWKRSIRTRWHVSYHVESAAPYALAGDTNGNYSSLDAGGGTAHGDSDAFHWRKRQRDRRRAADPEHHHRRWHQQHVSGERGRAGGDGHADLERRHLEHAVSPRQRSGYGQPDVRDGDACQRHPSVAASRDTGNPVPKRTIRPGGWCPDAVELPGCARQL